MEKENDKTLSLALTHYAINSLPPKDDKKSVWVRAIAKVRMYDGNTAYVGVIKDADTMKTKIVKTFSGGRAIANVMEVYPFEWLENTNLPAVMGEDRAKMEEYIQKIHPTMKTQEMSKKELKIELIKLAIKKQLR